MSKVAIGKRIEFYVFGLMLKFELNVYVPLADDHGVDALIVRKDGSVAKIQVKGCSSAAADPASFAAIYHAAELPDYWFVFHSETLEQTWLMSSAEFIAATSEDKGGQRSISFCGWKGGVASPKAKFDRFRTTDFKRLQFAAPSTLPEVPQA